MREVQQILHEVETGETSPVSGDEPKPVPMRGRRRDAGDKRKSIAQAAAEYADEQAVQPGAAERVREIMETRGQDADDLVPVGTFQERQLGQDFEIDEGTKNFLGDYLASQAQYMKIPQLSKAMEEFDDPNSEIYKWLGDSAVRHPVLSGARKWFDVSEFKGERNLWEDEVAGAAWFSDDLTTATMYADMRADIRTPQNTKGIIPAAVKFDNPLIVKAEGKTGGRSGGGQGLQPQGRRAGVREGKAPLHYE